MNMPSNDHRPLVTIVTPSFNQAAYLEVTFKSVLEQDYPHIEYIVIDGGSIDGSLEIIASYQERLAYWHSKPDQGQADAINQGLRMARGEIVAWLNSDDVYLPGTVRSAVETLLLHPEVGMVYADGLMVDTNLTLLDPHRYPQVELVDLLSFEVILQPTVFMRRSVLEEVGYLDRRYDLILDHELWVRMARKAPLLHVPAFWSLERTHPSAKTIAQAGRFVDEAQRMIEWASEDPSLGQVVAENHDRIYAGLEIFCARRLIDAGEHRQAFRRLVRATRLHPRSVARYWYKVVQAGFSALGLAFLFEWYRDSRRRLFFRGRKVSLDP